MKQIEVKDALPKGFKLHWYEIQGVLGRGGFGITYLARDTNLDVNVAIKEYFPMEYASREGHTQSLEPTSSDQNDVFAWGLKKFVIEARTLAKFSHKNIVRVSSVFDRNNTAYMVMDLEVGQSLADVISSQTRFTETQLTNMLVGLMDGLAFVHEKGFIHRDIKPANIILRPDGEPVLLDFGSARGAMKQTTKLTSLVSFGYTPFEQYHASSEQQGAWTDIYALAGTFHHLIMGAKPAEAMARATERMNGKPDPQLPLADCQNLGFSDRFLRTLDVGLAFRVEERPQTMGEWKTMLLGDGVIPAPSAAQPGLMNTSSPETVLMDKPVHNDSHTYHDSHTGLGAVSQESASKLPLMIAGGCVVALTLGGGGWWFLQDQSNQAPTQPVADPMPVQRPEVDLKELALLKAELQEAKVQANTLAEARAAELAELKADRERRQEEKRLEEERKEAARLAEEKRKKDVAEKRRLAQEKQRLEAKLRADLARDAQDLVDAFITAFEQRDADTLISKNNIASDKQVFIRQLLGAYESFSLASQDLQLDASKRTALTTLTITNIRAANGSIVKPSSSWRDIPVIIKPQGGKLTLFWQ